MMVFVMIKVSTFSTTILSAMLAGMDDREDPEDLITMEAMSGLARIFAQIDEGHVRPILINIALRIRPCFEKVREGVGGSKRRLYSTFNFVFSLPLQFERLHSPCLAVCLVLGMDLVRDPSWNKFRPIL